MLQVEFRCKTAWPYPIGKYRNRCLQIDFSFGRLLLPAHEIKMLCVQQGFPSKSQA